MGSDEEASSLGVQPELLAAETMVGLAMAAAATFAGPLAVDARPPLPCMRLPPPLRLPPSGPQNEHPAHLHHEQCSGRLHQLSQRFIGLSPYLPAAGQDRGTSWRRRAADGAGRLPVSRARSAARRLASLAANCGGGALALYWLQTRLSVRRVGLQTASSTRRMSASNDFAARSSASAKSCLYRHSSPAT